MSEVTTPTTPAAQVNTDATPASTPSDTSVVETPAVNTDDATPASTPSDTSVVETPAVNTDDATPASTLQPGEQTEGDEQPADEPVEGGLKSKDEGDEEVKAPEGAPEKYEKFAVEGNYGFTDEQHEEFSTVARELNLSQDQAQKLVKYDNERVVAHQNIIKQAQTDWVAESRKEYGDKYPEKLALAEKVYNSDLIPKALRADLDKAGYNYNPALIRMLVNVGEKMSEDTFVHGGTGGKVKEYKNITDIFPQPPIKGVT